MLGNECTTKILNAVSPHLISVELDMRLNICDLLSALAKVDPSVLVVVLLARLLFAYGYLVKVSWFLIFSSWDNLLFNVGSNAGKTSPRVECNLCSGNDWP